MSEAPRGNVGPVIFASETHHAVGSYMTFEDYPSQRALVLRIATHEEFLASRRERVGDEPIHASTAARLRRAMFYEVQTD